MNHKEDKIKTNKGEWMTFCIKCGNRKPKDGWKEDCDGNNS